MPDEVEAAQPNFSAFVNWGFQALLLALVTWGVTELSSLSRSVSDLNVKIAVVVERDSARGEALKELQGRVQRLEDGSQ